MDTINLTLSTFPVEYNIIYQTAKNGDDGISPQIRDGGNGLEISNDNGLTWTDLVDYQTIVDASVISISSIESAFIDVLSSANIHADNATFTTLSAGTYLNLPPTPLPALSGDWNNAYTTTNANSANWQNTYTTVNSNSATWNYQGTDLKGLSSNWQNTYNTVNGTSANWSNAYNTVNSTSANWSNSYTTTNANSANWTDSYTTVNTNSANWSNAYQTLSTKVNLNGNNTLSGNQTISGQLSSNGKATLSSLQTTGNVGIGQAPTSNTLDVNGTLNVIGNTTLLGNTNVAGLTSSGDVYFTSSNRPTTSSTGVPLSSSLISLADALQIPYFSRRIFTMAVGSVSGTGVVNQFGVSQGLVSGYFNLTPNTGAYYKIILCGGGGSLQGNGSSCVSLSTRWQLMVRMTLSFTTNIQLLLAIGADGTTGVPVSGTNVGMELTSNTSARLWRCNAGSPVYSSAGTIGNISPSTPTHDQFFWIECDGTGNLNLYYATKAFSGPMPLRPSSPICSLSGLASGFTDSTLPALYMRATSNTLGTTAGMALRDAYFTEF